MRCVRLLGCFGCGKVGCLEMFLVEVEVSFVFDDFRVVVPVGREVSVMSDGYAWVEDGGAEIEAVAVLADRGVVLPEGWILDTNLVGFRGGLSEVV